MKQLTLMVIVLASISATAFAGVVTRREFKKDGVTYVEETLIGKNGNISKSIFPKPGQEQPHVDISEMAAKDAMPSEKPAQVKPAEAKANRAMDRLSRAIQSCKKFKYSAPHPIMEGFTIDFQVHGLEKSQCKFTQTMPEQGLQTCLFNQKQRQDIGRRGSIALQEYFGNPAICPIAGH